MCARFSLSLCVWVWVSSKPFHVLKVLSKPEREKERDWTKRRWFDLILFYFEMETTHILCATQSTQHTYDTSSHWTQRHFVYRIVRRKLVSLETFQESQIFAETVSIVELFQFVNKQTFLFRIDGDRVREEDLDVVIFATVWHRFFCAQDTHIHCVCARTFKMCHCLRLSSMNWVYRCVQHGFL